MTDEDSDQPIVLRGRESRLHGEGVDRDAQLAKANIVRTEGSELQCQPHCRV